MGTGRLKTVAIPAVGERYLLTTGHGQKQTPLRKTEGVSIVSLPEETKKCGQGLALVSIRSEGVTGGSGGQDHYLHRG